MSCEHLRPAIGAYVLGGLDPDEAAAVRRHLETCPECAAEHDALAPMPGLLSLAGGAEKAVAEPLSPAFEERLLDAYARDKATPPRRRLRWRMPRPRWLAVGAVGAAAAAAAIAIAVIGEEQAPTRRYDVSFQNVSGPQTARAARRTSRATTRAPRSTSGSAGCRRRRPCTRSCATPRSGRRPPARSGPTPRGRAYVVLTTALRQGEYNAIRIVRRGHRKDGRLVKRDVLTARLS